MQPRSVLLPVRPKVLQVTKSGRSCSVVRPCLSVRLPIEKKEELEELVDEAMVEAGVRELGVDMDEWAEDDDPDAGLGTVSRLSLA